MARAFEIVSETEAGEDQPQAAPAKQPGNDASIKAIMLALKALSQRTIVALSSLFTLVTVLSAWYLWMVTLPNPSVQQLVGLGLYGVLVIVVNLIVKRM